MKRTAVLPLFTFVVLPLLRIVRTHGLAGLARPAGLTRLTGLMLPRRLTTAFMFAIPIVTTVGLGISLLHDILLEDEWPQHRIATCRPRGSGDAGIPNQPVPAAAIGGRFATAMQFEQKSGCDAVFRSNAAGGRTFPRSPAFSTSHDRPRRDEAIPSMLTSSFRLAHRFGPCDIGTEARFRMGRPYEEAHMKTGTVSTIAIGATLLLLLATTREIAHAQNAQTTPSTSSVTTPSTASLLKGGAMGELLAVYVPRSEDDIKSLIEGAKKLQDAAQNEIDDAQKIAVEADGRAKVMKEEIQTNQEKLSLAKKTKNEAAKTELEAALKRQKRELSYLTSVSDAARTDSDRLKTEKTAFAARAKALELELDVAKQNVELSAATPTADSEAKYRAQLRNLLEAQRAAADRSSEAAEMLKRVAEKRLKQLESLAKIAS
jgi:hypothetical protein